MHNSFQDTLISSERFPIHEQILEGLQFHSLNENHWVLSSSLNSRYEIYDSMYNTIGIDLQRQLNRLYSMTASVFEMAQCQKQPKENNCGLFAIANAIELLEGNCLNNVRYDYSQMRSHLINCFINEYNNT